MLQSLSTSLPALVGRQRCACHRGRPGATSAIDQWTAGGDGSTLAMSAILEARKVVRKFRAEPLLGPFSDIATSALNAHVRLFCPAFVHSCRMAKLQLIRRVGQLHKRHPAEDLACSVAALHISSGALVHMLTVPDVHTCTNRFVHLWSRAGLGLCSCAWLQSCHFALYG
jgi:hypothetical protein